MKKLLKIAAYSIGGFFALIIIVAMVSPSSTETATSEPDKPAATSAPAEKAEKPKPAEKTEAAKPAKKEKPKPKKPSMTAAQEQAIRSANDYLDFSGFSKEGLIKQLSSEYGEGFARADAEFAVNHMSVDWSHQAVRTAKDYLDYQGFSRSGLIDQLTFEGYTPKQAAYAADQVGLR